MSGGCPRPEGIILSLTPNETNLINFPHHVPLSILDDFCQNTLFPFQKFLILTLSDIFTVDSIDPVRFIPLEGLVEYKQNLTEETKNLVFWLRRERERQMVKRSLSDVGCVERGWTCNVATIC